MDKIDGKNGDKKKSTVATTIRLHDLPPRENAVGGFNRAYSKLDLGENDEASLDASLQGYKTRNVPLMRFLCLVILVVTGALVCGLLGSLIFDGWLVSLAFLLGGSAGVILAALFWADY